LVGLVPSAGVIGILSDPRKCPRCKEEGREFFEDLTSEKQPYKVGPSGVPQESSFYEVICNNSLGDIEWFWSGTSACLSSSTYYVYETTVASKTVTLKTD
jgi:hypothetical protein